jgi:hypothetical protein
MQRTCKQALILRHTVAKAPVEMSVILVARKSQWPDSCEEEEVALFHALGFHQARRILANTEFAQALVDPVLDAMVTSESDPSHRIGSKQLVHSTNGNVMQFVKRPFCRKAEDCVTLFES